ncbi:radical SAM protein [Prolixibacter bellariivorans]|uniref:7-carboxy-7-deazaguanine synthase n=2 Tax=Prolixibacter bellariivorans TaxID=314319 RepID=A0A5M4AW05_9BACT|nr:7-carboxy-7-deazaguanine synthase QueE [Prolixibacter bellariivorans]GET31823.1 radical SAM protein [Prolixibacter bellariivorans]
MAASLLLVNNGIFPITRDAEGKLLADVPATGLQNPGTIQGEGKLVGTASLFIRLSGCNLRCMWNVPEGGVSACDTPDSSFDVSKNWLWKVDEIIETVRHNLGNMRHVVITGGEPTIQHRSLKELCHRLKEEFDVHITIETNGTLFDEELASYIDLFSISPKLSDSLVTEEKLMQLPRQLAGKVAAAPSQKSPCPEVIQQYIDVCRNSGGEKDFQLKFVMTGPENAKSIHNEVLNHISGWEPSDILAMPLGGNHHTLGKTSHRVLETAIQHGWRYCPRIHIDLFGDKPGV